MSVEMQKVWFRCNRKNEKMFVLNSLKEMDYVPIVGDLIDTSNKDFQKSTFRIKPWYNDKQQKSLKNSTLLRFIVVSRKFDLRFNEWELICEPTAESLLFLLQNLKVK